MGVRERKGEDDDLTRSGRMRMGPSNIPPSLPFLFPSPLPIMATTTFGSTILLYSFPLLPVQKEENLLQVQETFRHFYFAIALISTLTNS